MSDTPRERGSEAGPDRGDALAAAGSDAEPTDPVRCPYCDRPFRERRLETLHRGLEHPDRLSERERAAFERTSRAERVRIRRFRLLAVGALVLLYFCLLFVYAIVT
ncbi:DUF7410 domain-containing protein [Halopiger djelfimassiliensis]|uniref:DUF7410 domain-containing protein n=1 Tax=Halopiger djelfimassiliensis TaxID=1293047 RepID=UPI0006781A2A|nr:hypothetical protein [Halopiger djelfimassiliensis]